LIIVPLKGWKSSNMWEQLQQIVILFRKKLRETEVRAGAEYFVFQFAI